MSRDLSLAAFLFITRNHANGDRSGKYYLSRPGTWKIIDKEKFKRFKSLSQLSQEGFRAHGFILHPISFQAEQRGNPCKWPEELVPCGTDFVGTYSDQSLFIVRDRPDSRASSSSLGGCIDYTLWHPPQHTQDTNDTKSRKDVIACLWFGVSRRRIRSSDYYKRTIAYQLLTIRT